MKDKVMKHMANATRLWNDENIETPGTDVKDFTMNYYGPTVRAAEQNEIMAPLNRYKTYFKIPGGE